MCENCIEDKKVCLYFLVSDNDFGLLFRINDMFFI